MSDCILFWLEKDMFFVEFAGLDPIFVVGLGFDCCCVCCCMSPPVCFCLVMVLSQQLRQVDRFRWSGNSLRCLVNVWLVKRFRKVIFCTTLCFGWKKTCFFVEFVGLDPIFVVV